MTRTEYNLVANRVRVSAALRLINDTSEAVGHGVSIGQKKKLTEILYSMEQRLFKQIDELLE
jgi:hypothetical protein